jgi:hypothetical protein
LTTSYTCKKTTTLYINERPILFKSCLQSIQADEEVPSGVYPFSVLHTDPAGHVTEIERPLRVTLERSGVDEIDFLDLHITYDPVARCFQYSTYSKTTVYTPLRETQTWGGSPGSVSCSSLLLSIPWNMALRAARRNSSPRLFMIEVTSIYTNMHERGWPAAVLRRRLLDAVAVHVTIYGRGKSQAFNRRLTANCIHQLQKAFRRITFTPA